MCRRHPHRRHRRRRTRRSESRPAPPRWSSGIGARSCAASVIRAPAGPPPRSNSTTQTSPCEGAAGWTGSPSLSVIVHPVSIGINHSFCCVLVSCEGTLVRIGDRRDHRDRRGDGPVRRAASIRPWCRAPTPRLCCVPPRGGEHGGGHQGGGRPAGGGGFRCGGGRGSARQRSGCRRRPASRWARPASSWKQPSGWRNCRRSTRRPERASCRRRRPRRSPTPPRPHPPRRGAYSTWPGASRWAGWRRVPTHQGGRRPGSGGDVPPDPSAAPPGRVHRRRRRVEPAGARHARGGGARALDAGPARRGTFTAARREGRHEPHAAYAADGGRTVPSPRRPGPLRRRLTAGAAPGVAAPRPRSARPGRGRG